MEQNPFILWIPQRIRLRIHHTVRLQRHRWLPLLDPLQNRLQTQVLIQRLTPHWILPLIPRSIRPHRPLSCRRTIPPPIHRVLCIFTFYILSILKGDTNPFCSDRTLHSESDSRSNRRPDSDSIVRSDCGSHRIPHGVTVSITISQSFCCTEYLSVRQSIRCSIELTDS